MNLSGPALLDFIKEQQVYEREERAKEREHQKIAAIQETEKVKAEAEREIQQRAREVEMERLAIQAKKDAMEFDLKRAAADKGYYESDETSTKPKVQGKVPRMPCFDEERDFMDSYLSRFERFAESQKWNPRDWATYLAALLKGRALDVYARLPSEQANSYDSLKEALLKRYQLSAEGFKTRFRTSKPEAGETPLQFLTRLDNYLQRWIELAKTEQTYEGLKAFMVQEQYFSVASKDLALYLKERTPLTITEMGILAEKYLEAHSTKIISGIDPRAYKIRCLQQEPRRCHTCGSTSHLQKFCPRNANVTPSRTATSEPQARQRPINQSAITCYVCGKRGHIARNCFSSTKLAAAETEPLGEGSQEDFEYQEAAAFQPVRPVPTNRTPTGTSHPLTRQAPVKPVCKRHHIAECSECIELTSASHTCNALVAVCQDCGQQHPIIVDACRAKDTCQRMPTSSGTVGVHPVTVLRDTGCSTVVVRRSLVAEEDLTGKEEICVLIDGTVRRTPVAKITVDTPYLTGRVLAVCMKDPLYDLIIGNIAGVSDPSDVVKELQAVTTRSQSRQLNRTRPLLVPPEIETEITPQDLVRMQHEDVTLAKARDALNQNDDESTSQFMTHRGLLYRTRRTERGELIKQLALPVCLRHRVMKLAHTGTMSGHQGTARTLQRITDNFWWPGITGDVNRFCQSCDICQRTVSKGRVPKVPLGRVPIMDTPFKRVAVDLVGPIAPPTSRGHRYILTVIDYATRYPEATALKNVETTTVAEALLSIFCRLGVPSEVLSDQGGQFTGNLMKEVSRLLSIRQLVTTPYHPQCNGLVERFNGTLKTMLKRMCSERPKDWDRYIDPLLFAYREAAQESLGFAPFEMLYGRSVRGPLKILRELWTHDQDNPDVKTTYEYVTQLRDRLQDTWDLAHKHLLQHQDRQKKLYDYRSRERTFTRGDKVLVLLPTSENKLLMQWKGPFEVLDRIEPADYRIKLPTRNRIFHANLLKKYHTACDPDETSVPVHITSAAILEPEVELPASETELGTINHHQKETIDDVKISSSLTVEEQCEVKQLLLEYQDIFTDVPNITNLGEHEIHLTTTEPIRGKAYPLPHAMRETLDKEIETMLAMGIIEPSSAAYASPVVMVKKPDGSARVCVDFRKLNKITVFDPEPMPSVEEIFAKLSSDRYFSKFDLSKGYWQVPMKEQDKDLTTFVCHRGLFRFTVMPFGLVNAPATFSRMMRRLLRDTHGMDNYLDDVLAHDCDWAEHVDTLREFFKRVRQAKLTLRPSKCEIGETSVSFLGHQLSEGKLSPRAETVDKIRNTPPPKTKKQLRSFLGLASFYRKYVPNFAAIAVPLTDLTKKGKPNDIIWSEAQEHAFRTLKAHISNPPILRLPDVSQPFILQTDASNTGLGAILLQEDNTGNKHPVAFASRKLLPRESRYSTIERECLAIVWGINKFHEYLYGNEFILETDHQPLQYLGNAKFQNGRLMRWALVLQPYRFLLRAIHGKENVGADCLSRNPLEGE